MNPELKRLYDEDQRDREAPTEGMAERDRARRQRVGEILASGGDLDGADYFHAALIYHHGDTLEELERARELGLRAAELGDRRGRAIAAYALDRRLVRQGRPQKYGTQWRSEGGKWLPYPIDPATTDAERAAWGVPSLEEQLRLLREHYNR